MSEYSEIVYAQYWYCNFYADVFYSVAMKRIVIINQNYLMDLTLSVVIY